jgi:arylsulfatase A-like enzyme
MTGISRSMRPRTFVGCVCTAAFVIGLANLAAQRRAVDSTDRPNIVVIITDDLGYSDLGSYGGPDARTPTLNMLAREGVRLTDAYANGAVCTPTRAAFISGRYQQRVGIEWVFGANDEERGLSVTGASMPELLKRSGYATGLFGKWHLGFVPRFGPNAHGFTEFFGFMSGAVDYWTHRRGDGRPDLYENTSPVETREYLTDEITRRTVAFIEQHANGPFFVEVAYNAVHWPFEPPDRPPSEAERNAPPHLFQGADDAVPATRQDYLKMLERADQGVAEILAALDRHALAGNTLVIFTNDNGGEWLSRNDPFFHRKGTLWEGGLRVPLIFRWPGHLPARKTSAQAAISMDVTRSILAATRTPLPADLRLDGIDLLPILRGAAPIVERNLFWRINQPDRQQKAVRSGRWKLMVDGSGRPLNVSQLLLFDLPNDPGERRDLSASHPDIVVKLKKLLADWEKDVQADARP